VVCVKELFRDSPGKAEETHDEPDTGQTITQPRFEPESPRIRV
jgi:hypothetical protein